ncbi:hypothetical protein FO440_03850 [Mucilaginibacter corticis]|uniref:Uncharacterized protein n=1 Tax=Mucilaginibacter corticis TaxID=2597670 RepID=A0A556MTX1_9SPHI|nr:hypothetical protein [Mucilaginibacter corticis]TSJ43337.1 hypothetical protein FO440_03850 [Mucilaginibacter corticis]
MISLYYKIWADALIQARSKKGRESGWQLMLITAMSVLQGINFLAVLLLLRLLSKGRYLILFPVHIFNVPGFNTGVSVLITYFLPFVILNYLLIFYNNKYNQIAKTYGDRKGKLYRLYALISLGIIVVPLLFKLIFL